MVVKEKTSITVEDLQRSILWKGKEVTRSYDKSEIILI